jgi:hypothetical protein
MNVKCPKCRFRFDMPASPGMTELQCNCPRCGTPFTYTVDDDRPLDVSANNEAGGERLSESKSLADHPLSRHNQPNHIELHDKSNAGSMPPPSPFGAEKSDTPLGYQDDTKAYSSQGVSHSVSGKRNDNGCLRIILIVAAIMILFVVLFFRQCGGSRSYTAEDVMVNSTGNNGGETGTVVTSDPSFDESAACEKAPGWIQGNWHVDTDYGGISLKIHGEQIAETSGGETSYGSFKYQNYHLFCDFGDNNIFIYRLVEDTKQIDAGNGILMTKLN